MYCFSLVFIRFYVIGGNQKPKNLAVSIVFLTFQNSQNPNVLFYAGFATFSMIQGTENRSNLPTPNNGGRNKVFSGFWAFGVKGLPKVVFRTSTGPVGRLALWLSHGWVNSQCGISRMGKSRCGISRMGEFPMWNLTDG